ncbi:GTP-binding protein [Paenibacillus sp. GSMTC-2017]|uniref:CobW family GTP-binding protein n=1 Tax=Paenibacillus sp. GSMTC-2017 TaxID=2794350 RepID=UPI0018D76E5F|nr:GTP-binding protein [Paenibacillus sp. GSMTC-2017]MBH5320119.1 GTP-binding protein [Paenibacillus sp. GSMTC-2017]
MTIQSNQDNGSAPTPIHLLSGFLGSGKTTLLTGMLAHFKSQGLKPAVIMNELGEINLDGELVDKEVPMAEMLSGCICCSIKGDLGLEIGRLVEIHHPDVIIIESTGAANPMQTLDGVTDAAMYQTVELRSVITVVDGPELLDRSRKGKGSTYKLMCEQIRCATKLLLNKSDKLAADELVEAQQMLREMNAHAEITTTVRCELVDWSWLSVLVIPSVELQKASHKQLLVNEETLLNSHSHSSEALGHHVHNDPNEASDHHHHSHEHVMVVTHYFDGPVSSEAFEGLLRKLPDNIYRAKGVVTFSDTSATSRFLFQYAYKESDFIRIEPQGKVNDVAVFIGEHFSKEWLLSELNQLN